MISFLRAFTRDDSTRIWEHLNEIQQKLNEAVNLLNSPSTIDLAQAGLVASAATGIHVGTAAPAGTLLKQQVFARSGRASPSSKFNVTYPEPFANGVVAAFVYPSLANRRADIDTIGLTSLTITNRTEADVLITSGSIRVSCLVVGW